MSQQSGEVAITNTPPNVVSKKRNWAGIIIASLFGGAVAVIAAPTIAALTPVGAVGFLLGTTSTGVLGSVVTRITGNAIDANQLTVTIYQYPAQQFYRETLIRYIGTVLETVLGCLRTNTAYSFQNRIFFNISDEFSFEQVDAKQKRRMFFDLSFRVIPKEGTERRPLEASIAPRYLPNYERDAILRVETGHNKSLLDGVGRALVEGAGFGLVGGLLPIKIPALGRSMAISTVPGKVNIIIGMSSITGAAGPVKNLVTPTADPDRAALFMEFATETQCHFNRLVCCAADNGVGLNVDMKIGSTSDLEADLARMVGTQNDTFYWGSIGSININ